MVNQRLQTEKIVIIGCGRAGTGLARIFARHGNMVTGVYDKNEEKAENLVKNRIAEKVLPGLAEIPADVTVLFIAVQDRYISGVAESLARSEGSFDSDVIFAHLSGVLSAGEVFPGVKEELSFCSFHPCMTFSGNETVEGGFSIAIEGDEQGANRLKLLAEAIDCRPFLMAPEDKTLYHAACVMASNYFVVLMYLAEELLSGMKSESGINTLIPLVKTTLANIESQGTHSALSGPVSRGDVDTLKKHLAELRKKAPGTVNAYMELAKKSAEIAGDLPTGQKTRLRQLFSDTL